MNRSARSRHFAPGLRDLIFSNFFSKVKSLFSESKEQLELKERVDKSWSIQLEMPIDVARKSVKTELTSVAEFERWPDSTIPLNIQSKLNLCHESIRELLMDYKMIWFPETSDALSGELVLEEIQEGQICIGREGDSREQFYLCRPNLPQIKIHGSIDDLVFPSVYHLILMSELPIDKGYIDQLCIARGEPPIWGANSNPPTSFS